MEVIHGERLGGVHPVGVGVAGADRVRHERVDRRARRSCRPAGWARRSRRSRCPPLFECSLMNSSLIASLLATRVVGAKKRVAEAPSDFLQFGSHGPPPLTKPCTPYPTTSTGVLMAQRVDETGVRQARRTGHRWPSRGSGRSGRCSTLPVGVVQPGSPKTMIATSWVSKCGQAALGADDELRVGVVGPDVPDALGSGRVDQVRVEADPDQRGAGPGVGAETGGAVAEAVRRGQHDRRREQRAGAGEDEVVLVGDIRVVVPVVGAVGDGGGRQRESETGEQRGREDEQTTHLGSPRA